ncbi:MAG TPA: hypothetical protein VFM93_01210 [Candidatus Limnocylindria bacterium]|nr:hypothetical protein [Candidatus Limnocylindria bacterium]
MVSSAIDMDLDELLEATRRIRARYKGKGDEDYEELRAKLPKGWPL